jgi:uncharacterized metal-binding protein
VSAGTTHVKASVILATGFGVGALLSGNKEILFCSAGALTGILLSGDLDVDAGNISNKIIRKRVGWFGERIWRWFWKPYAESFKHRGFASHFPVYSTFMRLAYIYFVGIIPFYMVYSLIGYLPNFKVDLMYELYYWVRVFLYFPFFYGLASSDLIHYTLDIGTKNVD